MRALVAAQLGFYAAAIIGRRAGQLAGVARTFVVLNAAAVVGLFRFLGGQLHLVAEPARGNPASPAATARASAAPKTWLYSCRPSSVRWTSSA